MACGWRLNRTFRLSKEDYFRQYWEKPFFYKSYRGIYVDIIPQNFLVYQQMFLRNNDNSDFISDPYWHHNDNKRLKTNTKFYYKNL